ncbi:hypothetical protein C4580_02370 [Candidatus Woesearchaeota archaeon]|nr:MAG: hypothetical protein C4580_02370 [Candidatus Woesearchaeota archaeon]
MSEISKVYGQYQQSLESSQAEYSERLKTHSKSLKKRYDELIKKFVKSFADDFKDEIKRLEIKRIAEQFFESTEVRFVAIDASCHKQQSANFISFYGGAYGSQGTISFAETGGKLRYNRWEFNKDVSMVAFVPIPPDVMRSSVEGETSAEGPIVYNDTEVAEISSLHTKIMQLAEIYLAYSLANSSATDCPRIILIDNSVGGILGNTSFAPSSITLGKGDFNGESLSEADIQIALAHPFNRTLEIPSTKRFQPHFRLIAEAAWREKRKITAKECDKLQPDTFETGARFLERIGAGKLNETEKSFEFDVDPRASWQKSLRIFETVCEKLFRQKDPHGVCFKLKNSNELEYFSPRDIMFLVGIGLRALIELCWRRRILLIGIVKDSMSRFYYKNFLGTVNLLRGGDQFKHFSLPLTDRAIAELLPNVDLTLNAPWATFDFDSCFMTLHSEYLDNKWQVKGYFTGMGLEVTRPERIFLRSLGQFFLSPDRNLSSHALFIDRLAYDGWDDKNSSKVSIKTEGLGEINPLLFDEATGPPKLQVLTMYLLAVLVRNHFPEALGYPDPLHQADWGAKSLQRRVVGLLDSSEWAFKSKPLSKTFRVIRDTFR